MGTNLIHQVLAIFGEKKQRKLIVTEYWTGKKHIPQIRMRGNWLADAGFIPGDNIDAQIDPVKRQVILTRESK